MNYFVEHTICINLLVFARSRLTVNLCISGNDVSLVLFANYIVLPVGGDKWLSLCASQWFIHSTNSFINSYSFRNEISGYCLYASVIESFTQLIHSKTTDLLWNETSGYSLYAWVIESFTQLICPKLPIHSGTKQVATLFMHESFNHSLNWFVKPTVLFKRTSRLCVAGRLKIALFGIVFIGRAKIDKATGDIVSKPQ